MSSQEQIRSVSFDDACHFIIKLGEAAHGYGSTAMRLETFLLRITKSLGLHGAFQIMPTEMIFAFQEDETQPQRMQMIIFKRLQQMSAYMLVAGMVVLPASNLMRAAL